MKMKAITMVMMMFHHKGDELRLEFKIVLALRFMRMKAITMIRTMMLDDEGDEFTV